MVLFETEDINHEGFMPHGEIKLISYQHGIKTYAARGPFNAESFEVWNTLNNDFNQQQGVADYQYGSLFIFTGSCLITQDTLEKMASHHADMSEAPQPCAVSFVIEPDTEGYTIMKEIFSQFYAQANVPFSIYHNRSDALSWLHTFLKSK